MCAPPKQLPVAGNPPPPVALQLRCDGSYGPTTRGMTCGAPIFSSSSSFPSLCHNYTLLKLLDAVAFDATHEASNARRDFPVF